ncbi:hypothetical protein TNCV_2487801 [Trichonephila clavipes]|uniref:Uncharacterized protein n=1 Tax=Trichonephila clavipes TaxID=2585209 RepID=A0A8X6W071_TRICX|nr:hypothetical protein TNCV_2487801 [Trichonephila clavipes]
MSQAPVDSPSEEGWSRRQKHLRWAARVGRDRRTGSCPSLYRPLGINGVTKIRLDGCQRNESLIPKFAERKYQ